MPVERCWKNGKPGFRWGREGKCYAYISNNADSRKQARDKAAAQGRAIKNREGE